MQNIPRNHNVGPPREDSQSNERPYSVNLSTSKTRPSSCQCTTTLRGKKGNTERSKYNSPTVANYAREFPRGHWSFLGPGSERKAVRNLH